MFGSSLDIEHAFDDHVFMVRTRVRRRRLLTLLAASVLVVALAAQGAQALGSPQPGPRRSYVVQPGDSLWSIAVETGHGRDPRVVVEEIARVSGLRGRVIRPGQLLVVPGRG
jgi:nucleoid-associated protein YgaU